MGTKKKWAVFLLAMLMVAATIIACGEGGEDDEHISHYQGFDCIQCHGFTMAGTVFTLINAAGGNEVNAANGHTVRLIRASDSATIATAGGARGIGNFAWNGSLSEPFFAQVLAPNGTVVNKSSTVHAASSLNCNSCHSQAGTTTIAGGAPAPGRIVNYLLPGYTL